MAKTLISSRISQYDQMQKQKLIELGQSKKSYRHILQYLEGEIKKSTQMSNFKHEILCFKNDGVYQLNRAIEEIYGVSKGKGEAQPSGGESNIETVDVQLANGARIKVPYGNISLPEAGDGACIKIQYDNSIHTLYVTGSCEFRFSSMIDDIIDRTKELLVSDSVYKNQAIELDSSYQPKILDLNPIDSEFMVLSEDTEYNLIPLDARIKHPEKCVEKGISLKYGALLEGPYGWLF